MKRKTFEDFVKESKNGWPRVAWVSEPGIRIYVRVSLPGRGDYELANMQARKPGNGSLTAFLDKYELQYSFYVECVHNPWLCGYLERRGYTEVDLLNHCYLETQSRNRGLTPAVWQVVVPLSLMMTNPTGERT